MYFLIYQIYYKKIAMKICENSTEKQADEPGGKMSQNDFSLDNSKNQKSKII